MLQNRLEPVLDPRALARELSNKLLIDGAMVPAVIGARPSRWSIPATQEIVGEAADGAAADVDVAVKAAREGAEGLGQARVARARPAGRMNAAGCSAIMSRNWRGSSRSKPARRSAPKAGSRPASSPTC